MLQAVNNRFNSCFQLLVLPVLLSTVLVVNIISNYATIRLYDEVKFPGFLGFPMNGLATLAITLDTLPTCYRIFQYSELLITNTREVAKGNANISAFLKSCNPLTVTVGRYFVIRQGTLTTFINIIIDNTINLLLTF